MSQLSYNNNQATAFAGMKVDLIYDQTESFAVETAEGLEFGIFAAIGTDPVQQVKVPEAAEVIRGISLHQHVEKGEQTEHAAKTNRPAPAADLPQRSKHVNSGNVQNCSCAWIARIDDS